MNPRYAQVSARAVHRREYCRAPEVIFNFPFEVEHIIPLGRDGRDNDSNWALACHSCNLFKSDFVEGIDQESSALTRLFHPRQDIWDEHFSVLSELGTVVGRTPIGRVTVFRLHMNAIAQTRARQGWIRLGLFP
jgi:hypothetical protein